MAKPVFTLVPDTARTERVITALTATGVALKTQRLGRAYRKRPPFVHEGRPAPARIRFDERATLRPIAWGTRDKALGDTLCEHLAKTMPPAGKGLGLPWQWNPRPYLPRWVGYAAIAAAVLGALAGFAR